MSCEPAFLFYVCEETCVLSHCLGEKYEQVLQLFEGHLNLPEELANSAGQDIQIKAPSVPLGPTMDTKSSVLYCFASQTMQVGGVVMEVGTVEDYSRFIFQPSRQGLTVNTSLRIMQLKVKLASSRAPNCTFHVVQRSKLN